MQLLELFVMDKRVYPDDKHRWSDYFGIELELEQINQVLDLPLWTTHEDGSLRRGIEYVLRQPTGGEQLVQALNHYYNAGFKSKSTERASTHIHINMSDSTVDHLRTMVMVMYVLESPLFSVIGESRKWAGYSMPLSEMEPSRMTSIMQADHPVKLMSSIHTGRNTDRYYGFNVASMRKHGTVEFRYFPGDPTREELESWLDLVMAVKKAAKKYTVQQIMDRVNKETDLLEFLEDILPTQWYQKLTTAVPVEDLWVSFNNIAAIATPNLDIDPRRDPLVFLHEPVLRYTLKRTADNKGKDYLRNICAKLNVVTASEWQYHISKSQRMDGPAPDPLARQRPGGDYVVWNESPIGRIYRDNPYPQPEPDDGFMARFEDDEEL